MKNFDELLEVAAILNGPDGCAWDRKQTFQSLQQYVLEEAHEVLEAVDANQDEQIVEELGDLLYTIVFYAKVADRDGRFNMENIIDTVKDKLIRRHPHVFAGKKVESQEEIEKNWDNIKKKEKGKEKRSNPFDGIPISMPLVAKAQKIIKILQKNSFPIFTDRLRNVVEEKEIGEELLHLIWLADINDIDAESALRRALTEKQEIFLRK